MSFERLSQMVRRLQPFELIVAQALVLLLLFSFGSDGNDTAIPPIAGFTETDDARFAEERLEPSEWQDESIYEIPVPDGIAWLDWNIPADKFQRAAPLAISMSGPFSAEVYLNGEKIGEKGAPGSDARTEKAGPIAAVIAVPENLVLSTDNRLAMRFSSNRAGYKPAAVVQSLYVAAYRADARRDLRYYAPALSFSGGLIAVAVGLLLLARARSDKCLYWLFAGVLGLTIAIAAEVSRSLVNYPYDWHQTRQAIVGAGFMVFAISLLRFVTLRWPAPGRLGLLALAMSVAVALLPWIFATGYDAKTTLASTALFLFVLVWTFWRGWRADRTALIFGAALIGFPLLAMLAPGDFLDRSTYIFAVSVFGYALLRAPDLLSPLIEQPAKTTIFSVQMGGRTMFVPMDEITLLKAAGNYTEIHRGGEQYALDNRGLSAIATDLPKRFFRIHRSYAVNLSAADSLTSQEGSRYWLALRTGERLPVSRSRVGELRTAMGNMAAD